MEESEKAEGEPTQKVKSEPASVSVEIPSAVPPLPEYNKNVRIGSEAFPSTDDEPLPLIKEQKLDSTAYDNIEVISAKESTEDTDEVIERSCPFYSYDVDPEKHFISGGPATPLSTLPYAFYLPKITLSDALYPAPIPNHLPKPKEDSHFVFNSPSCYIVTDDGVMPCFIPPSNDVEPIWVSKVGGGGGSKIEK